MHQNLTVGDSMKEIPSTITSKGQVTIPAEVRKHLGLKQGDKVSFVLDDVRQGGVESTQVSNRRLLGWRCGHPA